MLYSFAKRRLRHSLSFKETRYSLRKHSSLLSFRLYRRLAVTWSKIPRCLTNMKLILLMTEVLCLFVGGIRVQVDGNFNIRIHQIKQDGKYKYLTQSMTAQKSICKNYARIYLGKWWKSSMLLTHFNGIRKLSAV